MHTFKRKLVTDTNYLLKLVHYIHRNPVESELCRRMDTWKFSSFKDITDGNQSFIKAKEVVSWFDDPDNFLKIHFQPPERIF